MSKIFVNALNYLRLKWSNACPIFWPMTGLLHPTQISRPPKSDLQQSLPSAAHSSPSRPEDFISDTHLCYFSPATFNSLFILIRLLRQFTIAVLTPIVQDVNRPIGCFFSPRWGSQSHLPCRMYSRPLLLYSSILRISWIPSRFVGTQSPSVGLKLTF